MKADQELAFSLICAAARLGERCPTNDTLPGGSATVGALCAAGRLKVEIAGHNWRRAVILTGPDAGRATARNPHGWHTYKTIDVETIVTKAVLLPHTKRAFLNIGEFAGG